MKCITIFYRELHKNMSIDFLLWFNLEVYLSLVVAMFGDSTKLAVIRYLMYLLLSIKIILKCNRKVNRSLVCFLIIYLALFITNVIFVPYKRYAIVEAIPPIILDLPALLLISNPNFKIKECYKSWYNFCIFNSFLLPVIVYYCKTKGASYGLVSLITYSNIVVMAFLYIKNIKRTFGNFILIIINNAAGIIWGSRMPALASMIVILYMMIYFSKLQMPIKHIMTGVCGIVILEFVFNLRKILFWGINILNRFQISSRSMELLYNDIVEGKNVVGMAASSGRDYIWEQVITKLRNNYLLPHGFGYVRYITQGKYYYAHNLFLDLIVIFGLMGAMIIIGIIIFYVRNYRRKSVPIDWSFWQMSALFFFIRAMTGAHFLSDKYSIMTLALVFWGSRRNNARDISEGST